MNQWFRFFMIIIVMIDHSVMAFKAFNTVGYFNTELETNSNIFTRVVVDNDNKIIVIGWTDAGDGLIARFTFDGQLDTTFNGTGYVNTEGETNSLIYRGIAVDNNNNIVVVGKTDNSKGLIARYKPSGEIDRTFNGVGYENSGIGDAQDFYNVVIQPDGKIVVVGLTVDTIGIIVRYNNDGTLDTTFNSPHGFVNTADDADSQTYYDTILDENNKIVAVGITNSLDALIVRYASNGQLDMTFNGTGYVHAQDGIDASKYFGVAIDSDNKIIVAGHTHVNSGEINGVIARYNSNGSFDTTFNNVGYIDSELGTDSRIYNKLGIDSQGKIVVVGFTDSTNKGLVVRFDDKGRLDTNFNYTGYIFANESIGAAEYNDLAIQSDGKILVVGKTNASDGVIVCYLANGSLDSTGNWNLENFRKHYSYLGNTVGLLK